MILSYGMAHHDRVMQLNWLYFCGMCQMIPLNQWPNTAQGCNHQSTCMPQLQHLVQLLWYPMYYPEGMKARVSPVQWSKPHSILLPTQDSNPGGRIQNHKRWPLHYHCTHMLDTINSFVNLFVNIRSLKHYGRCRTHIWCTACFMPIRVSPWKEGPYCQIKFQSSKTFVVP